MAKKIIIPSCNIPILKKVASQEAEALGHNLVWGKAQQKPLSTKWYADGVCQHCGKTVRVWHEDGRWGIAGGAYLSACKPVPTLVELRIERGPAWAWW